MHISSHSYWVEHCTKGFTDINLFINSELKLWISSNLYHFDILDCYDSLDWKRVSLIIRANIIQVEMSEEFSLFHLNIGVPKIYYSLTLIRYQLIQHQEFFCMAQKNTMWQYFQNDQPTIQHGSQITE